MTLTRSASSAFLLAFLTLPAFAQEKVALDSPDYQARSADEKRELVWKAIEEKPYEAEKLPTSGAIRGAVRAIWGRFTLRPTFDDTLDARPKRHKIFHRWGTAVKVRWEVARPGIVGQLQVMQGKPRPDHPYTGVFKSGAVGIARLSLGLGDVKKLWAPGIGLKLFIDGKPSVNVHAIPKDGGQPTKDFMAATLDTKIDPTPLDGFLKWSTGANPTLRKVDHLAAETATGEAVAAPKAPYRLEFRPAPSIQYQGTPTWGEEDFRVSLARIPAGTVIYQVWAVESEGGASADAVHIANLRTESAFVASEFQDRELHFKHLR